MVCSYHLLILTIFPYLKPLVHKNGIARNRVREAVNVKTKETVAMKSLDKEKIKKESLIDNLKQEISILMMIDHPNVVQLHEVLASKTKIYLVLEYVKGGELWDYIRKKSKLQEEEARFFFRQIIRTLNYCKTKNVAHRDIKPENILIDGLKIKISDFGLSALHKDPGTLTQVLHTTCGTINYLAPEVINNKGYDGFKADIWSTGVLLFFCLAGSKFSCDYKKKN